MMMMKMIKMVLFCSLAVSGLTFDTQLVKVFPKQALSGVFEVSVGNKYALNASAARDLCQQLGLDIATKAQVADAQKNGLETCRFGWIDEQIAVVPRVQVKSNCGNGKTGVVVWRANPSAQFDAFCFNETDFQMQASKTVYEKTTRKLNSLHTSTPPNTQAGVEPKTKFPTKRSSPSPIKSSSSSFTQTPSFSPSFELMDDEGKHLPISSTKSEAIPAALLITVTFAVMLAVFLALYYFKTNQPCWSQKDPEQDINNVETELWEKCNENELQEMNGEREELKTHEEEDHTAHRESGAECAREGE